MWIITNAGVTSIQLSEQEIADKESMWGPIPGSPTVLSQDELTTAIFFSERDALHAKRKSELEARAEYYCIPMTLGSNWGLFSARLYFSFDTESEVISTDAGNLFEGCPGHYEAQVRIAEIGGFRVTRDFDRDKVEHIRQYKDKLPVDFVNWYNERIA